MIDLGDITRSPALDLSPPKSVGRKVGELDFVPHSEQQGGTQTDGANASSSIPSR